MSKEYIHFFSGSIIEANHLTTKLSENKIKYIVKDDHYSATLAGFGASNYLNSCKIFIIISGLCKGGTCPIPFNSLKFP